MEENNIKFEKRYKLPVDLLRQGYKAYQRKFVYPKSCIFAAIFLVLSANFVYGAVKAPDNLLAYLLIVVCLALAFSELYNPLKSRDRTIEAYRSMGESEYMVTVGEDYIEFSTVEPEEEADPDPEDEEEEAYEPPAPTRYAINDDLTILNKDKFILVICGKTMFYVIPTDGMTEEEKKVILSL